MGDAIAAYIARRVMIAVGIVIAIIILSFFIGRATASEPRDLRIIYFSASWCKYCPQQTKIIKEIEKTGVKVGYVDIDEQKDTAKAAHVSSVPTTMIVRMKGNDAIEYRTFKGVTSKKTILDAMK